MRPFSLRISTSTRTGISLTVDWTPTTVNVSHAQIHIKLRLRKIFSKLRHLRVVFTRVFFSSFLLCASVHDKICNLHFQGKAWLWKFLSWCHYAFLVFLQMGSAISLGWFPDLERGLIIIIEWSSKQPGAFRSVFVFLAPCRKPFGQATKHSLSR